MEGQSAEKPVGSAELATASGGKLLLVFVLGSYIFWILHSFAIRTSFSAIGQLLLKIRQRS